MMGENISIVHLPNFVSRDAASGGKRCNKESPKPYFLFVGRLEKVKGLQTVIPVFQQYLKAQLLIAGTGRYEHRLHRLAGGCDNIVFLGHQKGIQLQTLYRQAIAVIVPSIIFDVFPTVIIEAFMNSTPVIVRNLGGMPESVEHSGGGFVYETNEQLLAAMNQLVLDPGLRRDLGNLGYKAFLEKWTTEAYLDSYLQLIKGNMEAKKSLHRPGFDVLTQS